MGVSGRPRFTFLGTKAQGTHPSFQNMPQAGWLREPGAFWNNPSSSIGPPPSSLFDALMSTDALILQSDELLKQLSSDCEFKRKFSQVQDLLKANVDLITEIVDRQDQAEQDGTSAELANNVPKMKELNDNITEVKAHCWFRHSCDSI